MVTQKSQRVEPPRQSVDLFLSCENTNLWQSALQDKVYVFLTPREMSACPDRQRFRTVRSFRRHLRRGARFRGIPPPAYGRVFDVGNEPADLLGDISPTGDAVTYEQGATERKDAEIEKLHPQCRHVGICNGQWIENDQRAKGYRIHINDL